MSKTVKPVGENTAPAGALRAFSIPARLYVPCGSASLPPGTRVRRGERLAADGTTAERMEKRAEPLRWPCPSVDHPGVSTLYLDHPSW